MSFRINCEGCGLWIDAERRSKQYCATCRPKAVVLGNIVKALNEASGHDHLAIDEIVNQEVAIDTEALATFYPALAGENRLGVMTILNFALKDYGMIAYNGDQFEIVPWRDRPGVVLQPDVLEPFTYTVNNSNELSATIRRRLGLPIILDHPTLPLERDVPRPRGVAPRDGYGRPRR